MKAPFRSLALSFAVSEHDFQALGFLQNYSANDIQKTITLQGPVNRAVHESQRPKGGVGLGTNFMKVDESSQKCYIIKNLG